MSDPINYHPHSRFTLHEKAALFPFRDLIWNKTDGPFFDLKVDFPDPRNVYADGTAYLRVEDVEEMAHCLGMTTREETEALKKEISELKAQLEELPKKVESFKNGLSSMASDFIASLHDLGPVAPSKKPEEDNPVHAEDERKVLSTAKSTDRGTKQNNPTAKPSDPASTESSVEQGANDVPSSSSSDPFAGILP